MMTGGLSQLLIGGFFILHGLIHVSFGSPRPADAGARWPFQVNHSWLLTGVGLGEQGTHFVGTLLWITTTVAFALVGLGVAGILVPQNLWLPIALVAAVSSLLLLILYWHPWLVLGVLIDVAFLWALLGTRWSPLPVT
jgi:hypothetical protein